MTPPASRPRAALPALCLTQLTGWGVLYYGFPVLNPAITEDTGWSAGATTAAFSLAMLVSAGVGIAVGRLIDRRGPRGVMTAGSALGALSLTVVATAPVLPVYCLGWALAGVAMAATLYQPAFAALTRWWTPDHVRALTLVTLAGGLSSTVFAPVTAALADRLSWRASYLVLAVVLAAVAVPAHAVALNAPWPRPAASARAGGEAAGVARGRQFRTLAAALTLSNFAAMAVLIAQVPLLLGRGYSTAGAAWALAAGGLGQVFGRVLYASLARRTGPTLRAAALIALSAVGTAALALTPGPYPLLVGLCAACGMVRGNLTLLHATAITDRWGTTHYGRLAGLLAAPTTTASALAPFAGAALAGVTGGYPALFLLLAAVAAAGAALALASGVPGQGDGPRPEEGVVRRSGGSSRRGVGLS